MKFKFLAVALLTLVLGNFSFAEAADGNKVAVIDIVKIMNDSLAAKSITEQITKKRDQFQKQITSTEDKLVQENKDLTAQRDKLSQDAFDKKVSAYREKVMKNQEQVDGLRRQLDAAYANAVQEVQKYVSEIVTTIAEDKKIEVVIPSQQLLYAKKDLDITAEVLKKLDTKVTKIQVKFEEVSEEGKKVKK
jgi:outer membrane protein